jgi:hypothetical protein
LKNQELLHGLCNPLNVYGNTPFAELSGAFPASSVEALASTTYDFTRIQSAGGDKVAVYSTIDSVAAPLNLAVGVQSSPLLHQRNVTRGWTELTQRKFEDLDAGPTIRYGGAARSRLIRC